jgi:uncharacterized membrane protein
MNTLANIIFIALTAIFGSVAVMCAINFVIADLPEWQAYFGVMTLFTGFGAYIFSEGITR